ncbi:MAG: hypothetical protein AAGE52_41275 [Myxococcota bacterium]
MVGVIEAARYLRIIAFGTVIAIAYGVSHDMITAHLCVEYFTIGHPNLLGVDPHHANPAHQALLWGVLATWWVGAIAGLLLAVAARAGHPPRLDVKHLIKPVAGLVAGVALSAMLGGIVGRVLAHFDVVRISPVFATQVPAARHAAFVVDSAAHLAAYGAATIGTLVVTVVILRRRLPTYSASPTPM